MSLAVRRVLCFFLLLLTGRLAAQTTFSTVVVFGDSLSDTGNIAHLTQAASGGLIRYPSDIQSLGFDYTDGRFTDGKDTQPAAQAYFGVWVEQLAASFPAKPAIMNSLDGGTNYAYGDATTAPGTTTLSEGPLSITLHNMGQQLTDYLSQSPAPVPTAQTLYVLWGGSNDIYQAVSAAVTAGTDPTAAATTAATTAVTNEAGYLQELIAHGATNFLVLNVPPLGGVPSYATTSTATALDTGAAAFAQALTQALTTIKTSAAAAGITVNLYQTDVFTQFSTVAGGPMALGLSNISSAAQNIAASPDTYLIWDGVHPTTTGHHIVAALAANLFTPLVASSTALTAPAALITGQTVTLSAKVTSTASTAVATGLISFFNGTALLGSAALDATGTATTSFPAAATAGPYAVTAVYAGDTTYKVSASAATSVPVLGSAVATTTGLTANNASAATGAAVTFTATVTPAVATYGSPTGTVTFLNGTASLGTGTLSGGVATFTTSSLAAGTQSITATFAANGLFAGSTSAAVTETVGTPSFTASASSTSLTITAGSSGSTTVSVQPVFGFSSNVAVACGTLPAHLSCSFVTSALTSASGGYSTNLTIATNVAVGALELPARPGSWPSSWPSSRPGSRPGAHTAQEPRTWLALLLFPSLGGLFWSAKRRRGLPSLLGLAVLLAISAGGLAGCGSSSDNAAAGTYTVPVIFTATGAATQTVNLSVTIH